MNIEEQVINFIKENEGKGLVLYFSSDSIVFMDNRGNQKARMDWPNAGIFAQMFLESRVKAILPITEDIYPGRSAAAPAPDAPAAQNQVPPA